MKFVELEMSDATRQEIMISEAQARLSIKMSWPNLRLCNNKCVKYLVTANFHEDTSSKEVKH